MKETPTINPTTKSRSKCETELPKKPPKEKENKAHNMHNMNENPRKKYIFVKTTTTICSVGNNTHIDNNMNKYSAQLISQNSI